MSRCKALLLSLMLIISKYDIQHSRIAALNRKILDSCIALFKLPPSTQLLRQLVRGRGIAAEPSICISTPSSHLQHSGSHAI